MSSNLRLNRICEYCKNEFIAKTTITRFCSRLCNKKNLRFLLKNKKIIKSNNETISTINFKTEEVKLKDFLTVKDTSYLLNMSTKTIYRLIERNELNSYNFSLRKTLIRRKDIDTYFENNLKEMQNILLNPLHDININNSYTIQEIEKKYKISNSALYNLISRFKIPKMKKGKYTLVKKEDIDKLLN